jgi:NAD(P)-dependent dehydrogenase (short-subunit alcohol dehydrogenase family)
MNHTTRWALVTGASSGIGRAISVGLAEAGWNIFINHFRDEAGAEQTSELVVRAGRSAIALGADVGSSAEVSAMFEAVERQGEGLDVLVNNAGVQTWASFLELTEKDFDRTIATNLKGTFLCTQQAARIMLKAKRGSIVNLGSGATRIPFPKLVDYCASKGGIEMLTRSAATEFGPDGVRVNCVAPGAIENERTKAENPEYAKTWSALTPLRRCGTQADVANTVVYLCSEQASFVTGQTLFVDGGLWTRNQWPYE